jgi:hypothetical protein
MCKGVALPGANAKLCAHMGQTIVMMSLPWLEATRGAAACYLLLTTTLLLLAAADAAGHLSGAGSWGHQEGGS